MNAIVTKLQDIAGNAGSMETAMITIFGVIITIVVTWAIVSRFGK